MNEDEEYDEDVQDIPKSELLRLLQSAVRNHKAGHRLTSYYVDLVVGESVFVVVAKSSIGTTRRFRVRIQEIRK